MSRALLRAAAVLGLCRVTCSLTAATYSDATAIHIGTHIENFTQCKFEDDEHHMPDSESQANKLCLNISIAENSTAGTVYITCQVFDHLRSRPKWSDGFGLDTPTSGSCQVPLTRPCLIWVHDFYDRKGNQTPLVSSTEYWVYCSGIEVLGPDLELDKLNIVPTENGTHVATELSNHKSPEFSTTLVASCFLLLIYIFYSYLFLHFPYIRFLHETGFSVLAGLGVGFLIHWVNDGEVVEFDYEVFSLIVLPLVIFSAGYNLPKRSFFRYILYIGGFGIVGTVWIFIFIYFESAVGGWETWSRQSFDLSDKDRLILSSVLASTDSVAPMAFLPGALYPEIYAVVFGEGVLNDVVAILLSTAAGNINSLSGGAVLNILAKIGYLLVTSSAMGLLFGLGTSLLFKHVARLSHPDEVLKPAAVMFLMNYICYVCTELLEFSSIFALFLCALLCGHYAARSMNHHTQHLMAEGSELLSYIAEAFVFGYFGLTAIPFILEGAFSIQFIAYCIASIFFARTIAVCMVIIGLRLLRCGHRLSLACNEFAIIGFAGCMRGTIAYALILKSVPVSDLLNINEKVLVSTVLGIVLVNCLVFGGLFPIMLCLFRIKPKGTALLPAAGQNLLLRAQTRGLLPENHPLRPDALRANVLSRWSKFDENKMKPCFTRQAGHSDLEDTPTSHGGAEESNAPRSQSSGFRSQVSRPEGLRQQGTMRTQQSVVSSQITEEPEVEISQSFDKGREPVTLR